MRKNGFTLIELLAVIVILAIIALIATPIILGIINDARKESQERSAELYLNGVELALVRRNLTEAFNPSTCTITDGVVTCEGYEDPLKVDVDGETPKSGIILLEENKVTIGTVLVFNTFSITINTEGKIEIGEKEETNYDSNIEVEPGIYKDGVVYKTWNELKEENPNSITNDGKFYSWYYEDGSMHVSTSIFLQTYELEGEYELVFDNSINTIGSYALYVREGNINWKSITIPKSVTTIQDNAFNGSGIEKIVYLGTKVEWNELVPSIKNIYRPDTLTEEAEVSYQTGGATNLVVSCTDGDLNFNLVNELLGR